MGKRIKFLGMASIAAAFLGAGTAQAQTAAFSTTFYSDSSKTVQVGFLLWIDCDVNDFPVYHLVGSYSWFQDSEPIGYCQNGVMIPY